MDYIVFGDYIILCVVLINMNPGKFSLLFEGKKPHEAKAVRLTVMD